MVQDCCSGVDIDSCETRSSQKPHRETEYSVGLRAFLHYIYSLGPPQEPDLQNADASHSDAPDDSSWCSNRDHIWKDVITETVLWKDLQRTVDHCLNQRLWAVRTAMGVLQLQHSGVVAQDTRAVRYSRRSDT